MHIRRAIHIYRALLKAGIVSREGNEVRIVDELQVGFALNQPLSPFAVAAIELLDRTDPGTPSTSSPSSSPLWRIPGRCFMPSRTEPGVKRSRR
jgi:hypothetical protein